MSLLTKAKFPKAANKISLDITYAHPCLFWSES